ncbi:MULTISPECIES: S41 family peptidase [Spirosoma]|uniref:S41 family peptidase n=1 Tax=Spirosoma liriopis TaxID=2937440 RepID=A0ABT0HU77_9BACT|nr:MULTISPECIES: S41 family peptidase [Spirosoma]MCK8495672.1 S41 family peptidase [Spirosoma liriopis]UHG91367.1 S41 family peptidase [Spirosoma oryzicola]
MKIGHILLFVSLLAGLGRPVAFAQTLTPEQARTDINYLKRKLDLLHPGMGYYTPKPRMEQLYDSLYNRLTAPVDYWAFYHHVSPLVTALKDGHTNLNHRKNYIGKTTRFIPFYIRPVGEQYFISHNVSADTTLVRGTELVTINGRTIADLHRELMEADHSGSDGDNLTGRRQWSLVQFADYYAAWYGSADSIKITYRLPNDTLVRYARLGCLTLNRFRATVQRRYPQEIDRRPNLSVRIVDTLTHTAVLRVSTFMGIKKNGPFQWAFNRRLKRAFREIREKNVQNLVVDMQGNGGGIVLNSARLLRYWMPKPFTIMQHEEMKRAARNELVTRWNPFSALNFSLQYKAAGVDGFASRSSRRRYRPRTKTAFKGNLYFMMNGASFSAATTVLAKTLDAGMGTFVGEACGSAYWGDFAGHFKTITLPNSHLQVRIPLKKLTHAVVADRANGFTVEPDFKVARSYDDLLSNRDYVLDYTLRLIREGVVARQPIQPIKARPLQASR